jgi:hypothetical protein
MLKSFGNSFMNSLKYSQKARFIIYYYVSRTLFSPKSITNHTKAPQLVMKMVFYLSFGDIMIW